MALELIVDSLDSIPETLRGEYAPHEGKFKLNVNGVEDVTGLKKALAAERGLNTAAKAELAEFKKTGKTPAEVAEWIATKEAEALEAAKKAGKFDEVLAEHKTRADKVRADLEAKLSGERDGALSIARSAIVETQVNSALVKAKATPEGLDLLTERLGRRLKVDLTDGERKVTIMDATGKESMIGSGTGGLATMDDLVKEAMTQYPSLFEGTGAGGSGTDPKGTRRDAGAKKMARSEFDKLPPLERSKRMKEGWTLFD